MQVIERLLAMQNAIQPKGIENFVSRSRTRLQAANSMAVMDAIAKSTVTPPYAKALVNPHPTVFLLSQVKFHDNFKIFHHTYVQNAPIPLKKIQHGIIDQQTELEQLRSFKTHVKNHIDVLAADDYSFLFDLKDSHHDAYLNPGKLHLFFPINHSGKHSVNFSIGNLLRPEDASYIISHWKQQRLGSTVGGNVRKYTNLPILYVLQDWILNPISGTLIAKPDVRVKVDNQETELFVQQFFKSEFWKNILLAAIDSWFQPYEQELVRNIKWLFKKLYRLIKIDRRYLIRTIIRSMRLTTFDGKDDNNFDDFKINRFKKNQIVSYFKTSKEWLIKIFSCNMWSMPLQY